MKQYAVIGLKSFGFTLASELAKKGHDVIVIDRDEALINRLKDIVAHAVISDFKEVDFLKNFINKNIDAVIINLVDSLEDSILVTMAVKKLGVKNVIVKVSSEEHGVIIEKLGATLTINPEIDYAKQLSKKLSNKNLLDYLPLSPEYGIFEIALPNKFENKKLNELNLRKRYNINVIAVKEVLKNGIVLNPAPDFTLMPDTVLYVLGKSDDIPALEG